MKYIKCVDKDLPHICDEPIKFRCRACKSENLQVSKCDELD